MMKYVVLAGLVTLASVSAANATIANRPCGGTGTYNQANSNAILNGGMIDSSGLGSGGYARMNTHRNCGTIVVYIYTGTGASDYGRVWAHLDPELVDYDEAQSHCTASFSTTAPVYQEEGYSVIWQPDSYNLTQESHDQRISDSGTYPNDANFYGNATHAVVPFGFWGPTNLPDNSEFVLMLNCPQIHRPGGPSGG
jgi:hypothetical protein